MLVRQMVEATNGFYFEAAQQMSAQNLADLSIAWGRSHRNDGRTFPTWNGFVDHLSALAPSGSPTVDKALYWAVLNAIAEGAVRRSEIAALLDRPDSALHVVIETLVAAALIEKRPDPFNRRATNFVATEPMLRTERILIAPERARIERGRSAAVWDDAQPRLARRVYGPHLEWMAAEWLLSFASASTAGGEIRSAGPAVFSRRNVRTQLDVVAVAPDHHDIDRICLVGECKAGNDPIGLDQLSRLDHVVGGLGERSAPAVKRLLVARSGFTAELRGAARSRTDVELADMKRLYHGDRAVRWFRCSQADATVPYIATSSALTRRSWSISSGQSITLIQLPDPRSFSTIMAALDHECLRGHGCGGRRLGAPESRRVGGPTVSGSRPAADGMAWNRRCDSSHNRRRGRWRARRADRSRRRTR